ncbi:MAG: peptidoglycan-binding protein [Actinomycetota bacterium]|nr:peptidoglycan-binding protein [Actinomycetota bacterium]
MSRTRIWRRLATAALTTALTTGLTCGLLGAPAAHATGATGAVQAGDAPAPAPAVDVHSPPRFPPTPAKWDREGTTATGVYRVTRPVQGRKPGSPQHFGVRAWQELLVEHGLPVAVDGMYRRETAEAVKTFQVARGMRPTGSIDYPTARALLERTIKREAARVGMSADLLCGHLDLESRLNPAAVNPNGADVGLGQINLGRWNPDVSPGQAFDKDFAIRYMAERDVAAYRQFGDWRIALYDYNFPVGALQWKRSGRPSDTGKSYSDRVFHGCDGPEFPGEPMTYGGTPRQNDVVHAELWDFVTTALRVPGGMLSWSR